jgi:hypothetical protein
MDEIRQQFGFALDFDTVIEIYPDDDIRRQEGIIFEVSPSLVGGLWEIEERADLFKEQPLRSFALGWFEVEGLLTRF